MQTAAVTPEPFGGAGPKVFPIEGYAIIGDCRAAALVSGAGSIDWLCWPRFDSPPLLGALLDEGAGRFAIAPTVPFRSERRYVEGSNVLSAGMRFLPGLHPRMASEQQGPTVARQLEPPGFLALNYGVQTPLSVVVAHVIFGAILGAFYPVRGGA